MKILSATLLSLSFLAAAPAVADAGADRAEHLGTLTGGHWRSGDGQGSYRVILENVGFEHVSCRVWIEWLAAAASGKKSRFGQPPRVVARVPYNEISSGFWSCDPKKVRVSGTLLTLHARHAYSGESHPFCAALGAPGEYRDQGSC